MPSVSVILCTNKPADVMTGLPTIHHLTHTIQNGLKRQSFKQFELIISDAIGLKFPKAICNVHFPVYHVPVDHNPPSLQAARNNGLAAASGDFLIFLNDCCNFEARFIEKIIEVWEEMGTFASPLWIKECGEREEKIPGGGLVRDPRFDMFENFRDNDIVVDEFNLNGYFSCSLESALQVGGFNERRDTVHFGENLKKAGFHISIHRRIVLKEQKVGYEPTVPDITVNPFDIHKLREERQNRRKEFLVMEPKSLT
jgi:hypothetical protein